MKIGKVFAIFALGCLLALSFYCSYYMAKAGWANFNGLSARYRLTLTKANGATENWEELSQQISKSSTLMPDAAQYWEDLAYINAMRALSARDGSMFGFFEQAESQFHQSILLRPMSPVAWANQALVAHYLRKENVEIMAFFDTAMHYGRFDAPTQKILLYLGLLRWEMLSIERKNLLLETIERSRGELRSDVRKILNKFPHVKIDGMSAASRALSKN